MRVVNRAMPGNSCKRCRVPMPAKYKNIYCPTCQVERGGGPRVRKEGKAE